MLNMPVKTAWKVWQEEQNKIASKVLSVHSHLTLLALRSIWFPRQHAQNPCDCGVRWPAATGRQYPCRGQSMVPRREATFSGLQTKWKGISTEKVNLNLRWSNHLKNPLNLKNRQASCRSISQKACPWLKYSVWSKDMHTKANKAKNIHFLQKKNAPTLCWHKYRNIWQLRPSRHVHNKQIFEVLIHLLAFILRKQLHSRWLYVDHCCNLFLCRLFSMHLKSGQIIKLAMAFQIIDNPFKNSWNSLGLYMPLKYSQT